MQVDEAKTDDGLPYRSAQEAYRLAVFGLHTRGRARLGQALEVLGANASTRALHARALLLAGLAARASDDWDEAARLLAEGRDGLAAARDSWNLGLALALRTEGLCATGRLEPASRDLESWALNQAAIVGSEELASAVYRLARGDFNEALQLASGYGGRCQEPYVRQWAATFEAEALVELGRSAEALELLGRHPPPPEAFDELVVRHGVLAASARVDHLVRLTAGSREDATRQARAALSTATRLTVNFTRYRAGVEALRARLALVDGDTDRAERLLDRSLALGERSQVPLDQGRTIAGYLATQGVLAQQRSRARVARARDLLAKAGADPRSMALAGAEAGAAAGGASLIGPSVMGGASLVGVKLDNEIELNAVFEVTRAISSILDLGQLLERVLAEIRRLIRAERGAILKLRPDGSLECLSAAGMDPERAGAEGGEIPTSVVREVLSSQNTVLTDNATVDERFRGRASVMATSVRSILCSPLKTKNGVLGVIYLDSTIAERVFKEGTKEILSVFATQAAVAIENAEAYQRIEKLTATLEQRVEERTADLAKANQDLTVSLEELKNTRVKLLESQQEAHQKELSLARAAQQRLVPPREVLARPGARFLGWLEPAEEVGGDLWTYLSLPNERSLWVLADVTGHGLASAMVANSAKSCCDALAMLGTELPLAQFATVLSDVIFDAAQGVLTMSAVLLHLDPAARELTLVRAAHPAPMQIATGQGLPIIKPVGTPRDVLGKKRGTSFQVDRLTYEPGDRVLVLTDGLLERANKAGVAYGLRRLKNALVAAAPEPLEVLLGKLMQESKDFADNAPQDDDITLLALELL